MNRYVFTYKLTAADKSLLLAALRTLATDSPIHRTKALALASNVERADVIVSE